MTTDIPNIIARLRIFDVCDNDFLQKISISSSVQNASKGQLLFLNEDKAERFYIILSGWVKLFRETVDGTQSIIDILTTGHLFGDTSIFQDDTYPYSAEAVEQTTILTIPLYLLKAEIETNPKFAMKMMSSMARYRRQQDQEIENRTLKSAPQRIGCFLLRLIDQKNTCGKATINLPYDKTLVASRLGMQPETFSRALAKLKDAIDINVNGAEIEIADLQDLIDYSCAACSSDFPCHDLKQ